jgi:hypothetical protein
VNCQQCRAARALHLYRPEWYSLASSDADLQRVIASWNTLPDGVRIAMMALVGIVAPRPEDSPVSVQRSRSNVDETARRLARDCRKIVQGCLREEKWQDADREFFEIIRPGLANSLAATSGGG